MKILAITLLALASSAFAQSPDGWNGPNGWFKMSQSENGNAINRYVNQRQKELEQVAEQSREEFAEAVTLVIATAVIEELKNSGDKDAVKGLAKELETYLRNKNSGVGGATPVLHSVAPEPEPEVDSDIEAFNNYASELLFAKEVWKQESASLKDSVKPRIFEFIGERWEKSNNRVTQIRFGRKDGYVAVVVAFEDSLGRDRMDYCKVTSNSRGQLSIWEEPESIY